MDKVEVNIVIGTLLNGVLNGQAIIEYTDPFFKV